ncbi:hypothetical protein D187_002377 [Cystobacter fuscus DSM 2262]|uniref:HEAT repeat domain-containing protein n=1 Tax=Cystobacter fuscus (strain ATCC 25194 / DSM 2262 / NBRC 100088 / M29) TaxID=1242864 RepID=S9PB01_CYSF2|nr:HEAT repeat domain-containing protein [Cystobacter fuscus]EPX60291.1 hypothetical protein D187_002377 [Cystobacter fuscus DSM 2262]
MDVAELYRVALCASDPRSGALAGLGETGRASDASLLVPFLSHPRVAMRREAVTALGRLGAEGHEETLSALSRDPVSSVARAAAQALARGPFQGAQLPK